LVVFGQEPRGHAMGDVEIGLASRIKLNGGSAHGVDFCGLMGGVLAGGGNSSTRGGVSPRRRARMKASNWMISSSLTWPLKVGMMFSYPATIFAAGSRIDSRI